MMRTLIDWSLRFKPDGVPLLIWGAALVMVAAAVLMAVAIFLWFVSTQIEFG
jgi:hypothetical protein